jgi:hypothetical protein
MASGEMSVTPAEVIGKMSTMLSTRRSRMDWIGKSVTMVRANSPKMSESFCSLDIVLPSSGHTKQGRRVRADITRTAHDHGAVLDNTRVANLEVILAPKELRVKRCCREMSWS